MAFNPLEYNSQEQSNLSGFKARSEINLGRGANLDAKVARVPNVCLDDTLTLYSQILEFQVCEVWSGFACLNLLDGDVCQKRRTLDSGYLLGDFFAYEILQIAGSIHSQEYSPKQSIQPSGMNVILRRVQSLYQGDDVLDFKAFGDGRIRVEAKGLLLISQQCKVKVFLC
jgi:hypothetical protein